jgi:hypothetical protein
MWRNSGDRGGWSVGCCVVGRAHSRVERGFAEVGVGSCVGCGLGGEVEQEEI